jgi:molecular chaperone Hsp33
MRNERELWFDARSKVSVTIADVTSAAQQLAAGHLCGPTAAHYLAKALAGAALLGAELSEKDETLIVQMKCDGPLGGFVVECTREGTLRGYTEKKILDAFDATDKRFTEAGEREIVGPRRIQVTRSVPGRILSQGLSRSLDGYLAGSLQRKACLFLEASVGDDARVAFARGVLVEALPDSEVSIGELTAPLAAKKAPSLDVSSRTILNRLGLAHAELKSTLPLSFACRCSADNAAATLAVLPPEERATMPARVDVTCHLYGRTFTIANPEGMR